MRLSRKLMWHVGDVIRKLRMERDWTIPELARAAGVNKKTVSTLERGESSPTADTLDYLARALGYSAGAELAALQVKWCSAFVSAPSGPRLRHWRTLVKCWTVLEAEPESQRILLGVIRLEAQWVLRRNEQGEARDTHGRLGSSRLIAQQHQQKKLPQSNREKDTPPASPPPKSNQRDRERHEE